MWGAIIGDLSGSIYEFEQSKQLSKISVNELITKDSFYSDDTILTVAILDAILNDKNYEIYLKQYIALYSDYRPDVKEYFNNPFSPSLMKWAKYDVVGQSLGNGAMMRISPVGYLFNTKSEVIKNARRATRPSHNCNESIDGATLVALIIYYARKGYSKEEIISKLNIKLQYKDFFRFNLSCSETIDNCLYALFNSNSFEESLKTVISYGGDTDTNACIVGSMAEALYGIDKDLIDLAKTKIPNEFVKKIDRGYNLVKRMK